MLLLHALSSVTFRAPFDSLLHTLFSTCFNPTFNLGGHDRRCKMMYIL